MSTSLISPVDPISFVTRSTPFDSPEWLFEPLYDGHRALLRLDDGGERPVTAIDRTAAPSDGS